MLLSYQKIFPHIIYSNRQTDIKQIVCLLIYRILCLDSKCNHFEHKYYKVELFLLLLVVFKTMYNTVKEEDSLFLGEILKVVYCSTDKSRLLCIKLRKLKLIAAL